MRLNAKIPVKITAVFILLMISVFVFSFFYCEVKVPGEKPLREISILYEFKENPDLLNNLEKNARPELTAVLSEIKRMSGLQNRNSGQVMISIHDSGEWSRTYNSIIWSYEISPGNKIQHIEESSYIPDNMKYYIGLSLEGKLLWKKRVGGFTSLLLPCKNNLIFYIDNAGALCARDANSGDLIYKIYVRGGFAGREDYYSEKRGSTGFVLNDPVFIGDYIFLKGKSSEVNYEKYKDYKHHQIPVKYYVLQLK